MHPKTDQYVNEHFDVSHICFGYVLTELWSLRLDIPLKWQNGVKWRKIVSNFNKIYLKQSWYISEYFLTIFKDAEFNGYVINHVKYMHDAFDAHIMYLWRMYDT